jgi:hypothetical protein
MHYRIDNMNGTEGRTRTDKVLPPGDFESPASTNFATPARERALYKGKGER